MRLRRSRSNGHRPVPGHWPRCAQRRSGCWLQSDPGCHQHHYRSTLPNGSDLVRYLRLEVAKDGHINPRLDGARTPFIYLLLRSTDERIEAEVWAALQQGPLASSVGWGGSWY